MRKDRQKDCMIVSMPDPFVPGRAEAHEAGHAVAATVYGISQSAVTVVPHGELDPILYGGFVRVETPLFIKDSAGDIHVCIPIPSGLPTTAWNHGVFLLAGLAAELAATQAEGIAVNPIYLQHTAGDDLRLISELLRADSRDFNDWNRLMTETVEFVFERWAAIKKVLDCLMLQQRIEPETIENIVAETGPHTPPPQLPAWVLERLRATVGHYQRRAGDQR